MVERGENLKQTAWLLKDEELWRKASSIAAARPNVDVQGIYHVLWNLERSPTERLRRALSFGRLSPDRR